MTRVTQLVVGARHQIWTPVPDPAQDAEWLPQVGNEKPSNVAGAPWSELSFRIPLWQVGGRSRGRGRMVQGPGRSRGAPDSGGQLRGGGSTVPWAPGPALGEQVAGAGGGGEGEGGS